MRLKTFRLFENENPEDRMVTMPDGNKYDIETAYGEGGPDTYYADDFAAFVGAVHQWSRDNGKPVLWDLCRDNGNQSKMYWDAYVKGEREMTLIEMGDKLISVLHEDGNIIMALDNMDRPVDWNLIKDKI